MSTQVNVVGLEFVVERIDAALDYFVGVLGWQVAFRGESGEVAGDVVVLDGGNVAVTLLEPYDSGAGMLGDRTPRLTQVVLGSSVGVVDAAIDRSRQAGVAVHGGAGGAGGAGGRSFIPPEVVEGILGFEAALTFGVVGDDT
ncbi:MAG: VOC family protein [Ilumatobacter sp.]